jgi:seryl-tRNA synthetase
MHDLRYLREQFDTLRDQLGSRGADVPWEDLQKLLQERRELTTQVEDLRHQLKKGSEEVARLKRAKQPADEAMSAMKALGDKIKDRETGLREVEERVTDLALRVPNLPHPSVPAGRDAADNVEVRRWGTAPSFTFTPQTHWEVGEALGILDFERGAKLTGARFVVLAGLGAQLERALINYMLDLHTTQHGYHEVLPPFLVNRAAMTGTGQLPKFEDDLFALKAEDYFLIPTAEVPVTNLLREESIAADRLPIRYAAYTPCFRREAGSYGKDTRGLIRLHQFNKVELVAFAAPETSHQELERLTADAEAVLQGLGLHYRVMALCAGDMGFSATKTYDLEVWLPSQQVFREISSCSNFEAFQARRAGIRYRRPDGKTEFVHTLNGSGLAVGRTMVAILEQYQQADGSVLVPPVLRPYLHGRERLTRV